MRIEVRNREVVDRKSEKGASHKPIRIEVKDRQAAEKENESQGTKR